MKIAERAGRILAVSRREAPCALYLPGFLVGQMLVVLAGAGAGSVLGVFLICASFLRPLTRTLLSFPLGVGVLSLLVPGAARVPSLPAERSEPARFHLRVEAPPRYPRVGGVRFEALVDAIGAEKDWRGIPPFHALCSGVALPWRESAGLREGDELFAEATFESTSGSGPFSYGGTLERHGVQALCRIRAASRVAAADPPMVNRVREAVRSRVERAVGEGEQSGLLLSMGLGFRDVLSQESERAFKRTGLAHLLVVSGYQVTLVFYTIFSLISRIAARTSMVMDRFSSVRRAVSVVALLGAGLFVTFIGVEGSSARALVAVLVMVVASLLERGRSPLNALATSLLILSVIWPGCYLEPGPQLTYSALLGIVLGRSGEPGRPVVDYLLCCTLASLFTSGVSAVWFGSWSLVGFALNPVVAPAASLVACNLGYLALFASASGIDPEGWGLRGVARLLALMRDQIVSLSAHDWVAYQLEVDGRVLSALVTLTIMAGVAHLRARQFVTAHGV